MNIIVCVDNHWGIGNRGRLLVSIPKDMQMFKEKTTGGVVLGGRKTMEGLPAGTTLKGRTNIVLTSKADYTFGDAIVVHSVKEALEKLSRYPSDRVYIIGGEKIYRAFLPYCDTAYVTKVDYRYEADAFFPNLDEDEDWVMTHDSEEQTYYDLEYYFTIYHKNGQL